MRHICTDLSHGYLLAYKENIEQIPIPAVSEDEKQKIESLVQKCLDARGQGVLEWEAEIDEIVAGLYGLTEEEMRIIWGE